MSNDSSPVGGAHGFDSDALEEWVTETATQKGVSKQKLLDEILSSYWVLEELSGIVSESRQSNSQSSSTSLADHHYDSTDTTPAGGSEASVSSKTEFSELKSELQELRAAIDDLSQEQRSTETSPDGVSPLPEFSTLEGQLDDISSAVVEQQTETDAGLEELVGRVDTLSERLAEIESQLETGMSLDALEAAVQQNSTDHAELESQLDSEFDSIEQVLQHLLDTTDNIEYRLGAVSESRQEALRPLQERNKHQDKLTALKQEAIRHEVSTGVCDNCDQQINLGLLERPFCPSCECQFTGISKGSWLPFSKSTINTTDRRQEFEPSTDSPTQQWDASNTAPSAGQESTGLDSYRTDW